jgi:Transposase IS116/IS110/IS902 family
VLALQALRGMALVAAATVVAELGNITRFSNPRQLMAYLGLVPSQHSSGTKRRLGRITKAGNGAARRMLVEAAWDLPLPGPDQSRSVAPAGGIVQSSLRHGLESPNAAMWAISQTFSFGQTGERCSGGDRPRTGRLRLGDLPIGSACCRMTYLIDLKPQRRNSVPVDRPKLGKAGGTVTARRTLENIYSRRLSDAGC